MKYEVNNSMKYKIVAAGLIVIFFSFVPFGLPTVLAQDNTPPVRGTWDRVEAVPTGDRLEVRLKNGGTTSGKVKSVTETELTLLRNGSDTNLRRADILRVYQTVQKSSKKPILVGAGAGLIVGIGIGAAVRDKATVKSAVIIPLIGGTTAAIGALIGWAIRGEKSKVLIYESQ